MPENLSFVPDFSTLGQFNVTEVWSLGVLVAGLTIFSIMLTDFFDTMGTATAIAEQAGLTTAGRQGARDQPGPARRLVRRCGGRCRGHQLEHELHRERGGRGGGRPRPA